jgi:roadblock/LC7 domain-containing protein
MQRVTCFSQVKFEDTDTCPRDKKWLERLTKFVHKGNNFPDVSWFTYKEAPLDDSLSTICHAPMAAMRATHKFLVNANCYAYRERYNKDIAPFIKYYFDWIIDPEKSLWPEIQHRLVILEDDKGKQLGQLWLDPSHMSIVPLVHFVIAGPRFVTEHYEFAQSAAKAYEALGDMRAAFWAGCNYRDGKLYTMARGHVGLNNNSLHIPLCLLGKPKVPQHSLLERGASIYVNQCYNHPSVAFKLPDTLDKFIEVWPQFIKEKK